MSQEHPEPQAPTPGAPAPPPQKPLPYPEAAGQAPYPGAGGTDHDAWHRQPVISIAIGLVCLVVCLGFVGLFISSGGMLGVRAVGYAIGAVGIYFLYGGIMGLKER